MAIIFFLTGHDRTAQRQHSTKTTQDRYFVITSPQSWSKMHKKFIYAFTVYIYNII